jgi:hypothetical protein
VRLSRPAIGIWLVVGVIVAVGAFLVGKGSGSEAADPIPPAATAPQPVEVPALGAVAALPAMRHPKQPKKQTTAETGTEEAPTGEGEVEETFSPVEEQTFSEPTPEPSSESTGTESTGGEPQTSTSEPSSPSESTSGGGGEELEPEG